MEWSKEGDLSFMRQPRQATPSAYPPSALQSRHRMKAKYEEYEV